MKAFLLVAAGGALGSVLRYLAQILLKDFSTAFPFNTFLVNIVGCFIIGYVFAGFSKTPGFDQLRLFLVIGILGGFTTFSSFAVESIELFRSGLFTKALLYVLLSNVLGITAAWFGYSLKS